MTENAKTRRNAYSKWHRKQEHFFKHTFRSFQYIRFVKKQFLLSQTTGKGGGGGILNYVPLWTKLAKCTSRSCILQNQTTIRPLRHILRTFLFLDKGPLWGPRGSGLDQNCTCTTRPWGQQNVTINRSLWYLVMEEIEEQDIVYGQTDGLTDGRMTGYRISSTGL